MAITKRIAELDGLRGLAVIMVMVWHFVGSMMPRESVLSEVVYAATIFGRSGVDLFFVLSGLLIIGILVDNKEASNVFRVFYFRRFLRIYPPYVLLIVLYWICYVATGESAAFNTDGGLWTQILAQVTFTWNGLMAITDGPVARGFSVTWSVAIEEWFYIFAPAFIILVPRRHLPALLITVAVLSAGGRLAFQLMVPGAGLAPYVLTPFRVDGLCIGGLIAIAIRSQRALGWLEANKTMVGFGTLGFALSVPILVGLVRNDLYPHMYIWGHSYLALGYGSALVWLVSNIGSRRTRLFRARPLMEAGRYSYSLYLFHPLFISLFFLLAGRPEVLASWQDAGLAAAALLTSLALCIALYWTIERRAQHFGHRAPYMRPNQHQAFQPT